jgi:NAD(P)-dependent dehydrogenase (short-subunit alcohol dehydrogenase family)
MTTENAERNLIDFHNRCSENAGVILISGAASGLGLAFVQHYAESNQEQAIIAVDRDPITLPGGLQSQGNVKTFIIDITDLESIESFSKSLENTTISLLIQCAGVRGLVPSAVRIHHGDITSAEALDVMDRATMQTAFDINCIGTLFLVRALLPNLLRYSQGIEKETQSNPPRVVVLGSRMGSVSSNNAGGAYAYRASKAALNAVIRSLSLDVKEVAFAILHPGRVKTNLVPWKEDGAMSTSQAIKDCVKVISGIDLADSGSFFDRNGERIGW